MIKLRKFLPENIYDDPKRWEFKNKQWQDDLNYSDKTKKFKDYTLTFIKNVYDGYSKILAVASDGIVIGELFFGKPNEHARNIEGAIEIRPDHRRRGLASEMYKWAEELSAMTIHPSHPHSSLASKFWNQPNIKFGPMKT